MSRYRENNRSRRCRRSRTFRTGDGLWSRAARLEELEVKVGDPALRRLVEYRPYARQSIELARGRFDIASVHSLHHIDERGIRPIQRDIRHDDRWIGQSGKFRGDDGEGFQGALGSNGFPLSSALHTGVAKRARRHEEPPALATASAHDPF